MPTLTASQKAELDGYTDEKLSELVAKAQARKARGAFMSRDFRAEADFALAALALRRGAARARQ